MKSRTSEEKSFWQIYRGMVNGDIGEGSHSTESPGKEPFCPSELKNAKHGRARSSLGLEAGTSLKVCMGRIRPPLYPPRAGSRIILVLWFSAPFWKTWQIILYIAPETSSHVWNVFYVKIRIRECESLKGPQCSPSPVHLFCQVRKLKFK